MEQVKTETEMEMGAVKEAPKAKMEKMKPAAAKAPHDPKLMSEGNPIKGEENVRPVQPGDIIELDFVKLPLTTFNALVQLISDEVAYSKVAPIREQLSKEAFVYKEKVKIRKNEAKQS